MARVRVVTDSACDLPAALAEEQGITVVPLSIRFGPRSSSTVPPCRPMTSGHGARPARCCRRLLPPRPVPFKRRSSPPLTRGTTRWSASTSRAAFPAPTNQPRTAADSVKDRIRVLTVDSRTATMGQGLIVLDVAALAATGASPEDIVARSEALIKKTQVFGAVDNLEHLEKGGRIGGAKALLGTLLAIKPVLTVTDGIVGEESKQRTRSRSLRYLAGKAQEAGPISRMAVCNGAATDIDDFLSMLDGVKSEHPVVVVDLGPVVGTHTGPGTIGLCLITAD